MFVDGGCNRCKKIGCVLLKRSRPIILRHRYLFAEVNILDGVEELHAFF